MVGTAGAIIITILVLAAVAAIGWVGYTRWRAQKLGLPPPSFTSFLPFLKSDHHHSSSSYGASGPRSGGIQGWFSDQFAKLKNSGNRSAAGAYEGGGGYSAGGSAGGGRRRGFGALDPDEAWDARVGTEADTFGPGGYYEEQELGLHHGGGAGAGAGSSRRLGPYGEGDHSVYELGGGGGGGAETYSMNLATTPGTFNGSGAEQRARGDAPRSNPFDDDAAEPANISLRGVSPRPMEGAEAGHGGGAGGKRANSPTGRRSIFTEEV